MKTFQPHQYDGGMTGVCILILRINLYEYYRDNLYEYFYFVKTNFLICLKCITHYRNRSIVCVSVVGHYDNMQIIKVRYIFDDFHVHYIR